MELAEIKQTLQKLMEGYDFKLVGLLDNEGRILAASREAASLAKLVERELITLVKNNLEPAGFTVNEGGERAYPDIELIAPDGTLIAVDVKCASYKAGKNTTNSRITLYTFGTYLTNRDTKDGILRPYNDYKIHLDLVSFYQVRPQTGYIISEDVLSLDKSAIEYLAESHGPLAGMYHCVIEPWRVSSHRVSSGTRDYVGAVMGLDDFKNEQGVFRSAQAFYNFWGNVPAQLRSIHHQIFGNSKKKIPPSHCYVEHMSELLGIEQGSFHQQVLNDIGFPCFKPDKNTRFKELEGLTSIDEQMLFYPRIVFNYLGKEPQIDGVSVEVELQKKLKGSD